MSSTIQGLLKTGKDDATALSAPGGVPLTYRALRAHVADVVRALNAQGIGANDRVAIVLDNGPEMVVRNSAVGVLEWVCAISDTPPKMNSVICRTGIPSFRATTQWLSSCSSTHANSASELRVPAIQ